MRCEFVAARLPEIVENREVASSEIIEHIDTCLRCQAELAGYRKLLRGLHSLRTDVLEPAPGTLAGILANLEAAGERRAVRSMVTGRRAAYAGGVAMAGMAGAVGVVVFAARRRRLAS